MNTKKAEEPALTEMPTAAAILVSPMPLLLMNGKNI